MSAPFSNPGLPVTELPWNLALLLEGAHRFCFSNCCENLNAEFPGTSISTWKCKFQGNYFKETNLGIKVQQRWERLLHLHFHRFCQFSDLALPSLNPPCSQELGYSL